MRLCTLFNFSACGHIHQYTLGVELARIILLQLEFSSCIIDEVKCHFKDLLNGRLKDKAAFESFHPLIGHHVCNFLAGSEDIIASEDDRASRGRAISCNGDRLLRHPLRRNTDCRHAADFIGKPALCRHRTGYSKYPRIVYAGAKSQNRRHAGCFADLAQTGAGVLHGKLRRKVSTQTAGVRTAPCGNNKNVSLDKFGYKPFMVAGCREPRVVASDNRSDTANSSRHNGVIKWPEGMPPLSAEHVLDIFMRETCNHIEHFHLLTEAFLCPVREIVYRNLEN